MGKVVEYPWGYFEAKTQNFFFRVYKHGGGNGRPITFRAECAVTVNKKNYLIEYRHFHEWDYRDKEDAFASAKNWLLEMINRLSAEIADIGTDVGGLRKGGAGDVT